MATIDPNGPLKGKVALVTGASRGIGEAIAARLAMAWATIAVSARTAEAGESRLPGTLSETVARLEAAGATARFFKADLATGAERERLVADVEDAFGGIDVLINNAAITYFAPVADFTEKRFKLMMEVQVYAPFHLAQLVLPGMKAKGGGAIVNISSPAGIHPKAPYTRVGGGTVYGMCKAALERFSTGLANELYADRIVVNALSPTRVVPTAGTVHHHLTTFDDPDAEPTGVMAEAALRLCRPGPEPLTGLVAYSQDLV